MGLWLDTDAMATNDNAVNNGIWGWRPEEGEGKVRVVVEEEFR